MNPVVKIEDTCVKCLKCTKECPLTPCLSLKDGRIHYEGTGCVKCGHCFAVCPTGSITFMGTKASDVQITKYDDTLHQTVHSRRSVRCFKPEPILHETLDRLIKEGERCSASGCNSRTTQFVVLGRKKLDEVAPIVAQLASGFFPMIVELQKTFDAVFHGAPHVILTMQPAGSIVLDQAIAMTTVEVLAVEQGLGTFWCGFFSHALEDKVLATKVGIPEGFVVGCALAIGKPAVQYMRTPVRNDATITYIE